MARAPVHTTDATSRTPPWQGANLFTNYFDHLVGTELDAPLAPGLVRAGTWA